MFVVCHARKHPEGVLQSAIWGAGSAMGENGGNSFFFSQIGHSTGEDWPNHLPKWPFFGKNPKFSNFRKSAKKACFGPFWHFLTKIWPCRVGNRKFWKNLPKFFKVENFENFEKFGKKIENLAKFFEIFKISKKIENSKKIEKLKKNQNFENFKKIKN